MRIKNLWTIVFPLTFFTVVYYLAIIIDKSLNLPKIPTNLNLISYVLIFIGSVLVIWVFLLFATFGEGTPVPKQVLPLETKKLVVVGPYRYTRNPMAIGFLLILIGMTFYFQSYAMLLLTIIMPVIGHLFIVNVEEKDMEQRFGKAYLEYKKKVPRWLPRFHS